MQVVHDYALARFYMWAQTGQCIHIAMHIPTGKIPIKKDQKEQMALFTIANPKEEFRGYAR